MKDYIKKIVHQIFDKWIVVVAMAVFGGVGTAAVDYFRNYYYLPAEVDELKQIIHIQDSIIKVHTAFLAEDYIILTNAGLIKK